MSSNACKRSMTSNIWHESECGADFLAQKLGAGGSCLNCPMVNPPLAAIYKAALSHAHADVDVISGARLDIDENDGSRYHTGRRGKHPLPASDCAGQRSARRSMQRRSMPRALFASVDVRSFFCRSDAPLRLSIVIIQFIASNDSKPQ